MLRIADSNTDIANTMHIMVTCHLACAGKTANMSSLLALAAQGDDKIAGSQSE
ncbi:hypothetical protein [uncultured Pseudoteredinibacter sp.]|uniref:hypothetical protein n=1 Tax=uncultured Pseudoteredinibacter sp. TaxID=1641701 RepID=UPI00260B0609|nr:hypothetical protein [uncultured Pseudoteredinibacter sp.]